ncbi:MAG TPA: DNA recombination protein RmuC [Pirellulales bacterium]|jgi:DNA recombination protein RmuC|nr:DNA recombination protein RmuC [Pirellulales bacterium]
MQAILPVVCLIVGAAFGGALVWWSLRQQMQHAAADARGALGTEHAVLQERLQQREQQLAQATALAKQHESQCAALTHDVQQTKQAYVQTATTLKEEREQAQEQRRRDEQLAAELKESRESLAAAKEQLVHLETVLDKERKQADEKLKLLAEAEQKMSNSFKALAAEVLQSNNQSFLDLAKTTLETHQKTATGDLESRQKAIDELVKPVKESLEKVDAKIQELETKREGAYSKLTQQVQGLLDNGQQLRTETANLVKALRAPNVRGRWGEIQLKRVVEMAGMLDHCDFREQQSRETEDGQLRPDLTVQLPGDVFVVVDAKTPLSAYLEAVESGDDAVRQQKFQEHAQHLKKHISDLGKKSYWSQFDRSPEFVVLFLPGENFFSAALERLPSLIEEGVEQRVLIATPMTLISLLRAVAAGWRQEQLAKNAEEISQYGRILYERVRKLGEHLAEIGNSLGRAVESYNKGIGSLERMVLPAARRFRELGASTGDEIKEIPLLESIPRALQAEELVAGATSRRDEPRAQESLDDDFQLRLR